jgi:hypothetical protein
MGFTICTGRRVGYSYTMTRQTWRFAKGGKSTTAPAAGLMNNGDANAGLDCRDRAQCPARIHFA